MTFVNDERKISKIDSMGRSWYRRVLILKCDHCRIQFERTGSSLQKYVNRQLHFCSKEHADEANRPGGLLRAQIEKNNLEKFGATSPFQSEKCLEISRQTCLLKYGVEHTGSAKELIQKRINTCVEKYGSNSALGSVEIRSKWDVKAIIQKARSTYQRNESGKTAAKKRHVTMKERKLYGKSKIEDEFYELLCNVFGNNDVVRQSPVETWAIDFYVTSRDLFIQFDGIYWHGLDRSLEDIALQKSSRDTIILYKWNVDRKQDDWFQENNRKLIRVTDSEFKKSNRTPNWLSQRLI